MNEKWSNGRKGRFKDSNFDETTLHDQEIWVIDVELAAPDKRLRFVRVEKAFRDVGGAI